MVVCMLTCYRRLLFLACFMLWLLFCLHVALVVWLFVVSCYGLLRVAVVECVRVGFMIVCVGGWLITS